MPRADWKIAPAGNGPVVTVTVFANSDVEDEEDEDELDADVLPPDDTVEVAMAVVLPIFCCGRGQTLILGLEPSNCRTESGSALKGGRIKRIFAFCNIGNGCTDITVGAAGAGT